MRDDFRLERARTAMGKAGLDALICRLPENVLYLSGYWPYIGASVALFPREGEPALVLPEEETDWLGDCWVEEKVTYKVTDRSRPPILNDKIAERLGPILQKRRLVGAKVGYEGSFETVACNNQSIQARVVAEPFWKMLKSLLPQATFVDATEALKEARRAKSPFEIEKMWLCNEVSCFGMEAAQRTIRPGVREAEVAAAIEAEIYGRGVGYKGVGRARGFAYVMSGPNSANSFRPYCASTDRTIEKGDLVLVELDSYADGYFNDLTRVFVAGEPPSSRQLEMADVVLRGLGAALGKIRPGAWTGEAAQAALDAITERGYGQYYPHYLGHGLGNTFHEPPLLDTNSKDTFELGNVFAMEPAVYIPGYGGFREEDNYALTEKGPELLTPFPQGLNQAPLP